MKNDAFWDRSWEAVSAQQAEDYIRRPDPRTEPLIRFLRDRHAHRVCDAGCGCGKLSFALAASGFTVSGFDVSAGAVALARRRASECGRPAPEFCTADIRSTGYADGTFDAAVALDVIDHLPITEGAAAVRELLRIVRPGGCVLLTLDRMDSDYAAEPHEVNCEGDLLFTGGKRDGMVFHPYSAAEIGKLTRGCRAAVESSERGFTVILEKPRVKQGKDG